jgi:hypothetical protein
VSGRLEVWSRWFGWSRGLCREICRRSPSMWSSSTSPTLSTPLLALTVPRPSRLTARVGGSAAAVFVGLVAFHRKHFTPLRPLQDTAASLEETETDLFNPPLPFSISQSVPPPPPPPTSNLQPLIDARPLAFLQTLPPTSFYAFAPLSLLSLSSYEAMPIFSG